MSDGRLVRHQHGGRAEHVAERVVHQVQERRCVQVGVPHHLTQITGYKVSLCKKKGNSKKNIKTGILQVGRKKSSFR